MFLARFGLIDVKKSFVKLAATLLSVRRLSLKYFREILLLLLLCLVGKMSDNDFQHFFESFLYSLKLSLIKLDLAC